jgi:DNA primase
MSRFGGIHDAFTANKRLLLSVNGERLLRERYGVSEMRRDGDELRMRCPLNLGLHKHGDRTGKFSLNVKKNVCGCWVCGAGNILWLVKHAERDEDGNPVEVSDAAAIEIAKQYAHELTDDEFAALIAEEMNGQPYQEPRAGQTDYSGVISQWTHTKHPYWADRGFNIETVEMWSLGFDPEENRVVVPHRFDGRYVGYLKRTLADTQYGLPTDRDIEKKWKNSWQLPRDMLFGYDTAKYYDSVVVVEAPLSAIYLWQCSIPNVVATFGSKTSAEQVRLLRRFRDVVVWYDADLAGRHGARTIIDGLRGHSDVWLVDCSEGDPNEVSRGILRSPDDCWRHIYGKGLIPGFLWNE